MRNTLLLGSQLFHPETHFKLFFSEYCLVLLTSQHPTSQHVTSLCSFLISERFFSPVILSLTQKGSLVGILLCSSTINANAMNSYSFSAMAFIPGLSFDPMDSHNFLFLLYWMEGLVLALTLLVSCSLNFFFFLLNYIFREISLLLFNIPEFFILSVFCVLIQLQLFEEHLAFNNVL